MQRTTARLLADGFRIEYQNHRFFPMDNRKRRKSIFLRITYMAGCVIFFPIYQKILPSLPKNPEPISRAAGWQTPFPGP
jgi:hypothetical protein